MLTESSWIHNDFLSMLLHVKTTKFFFFFHTFYPSNCSIFPTKTASTTTAFDKIEKLDCFQPMWDDHGIIEPSKTQVSFLGGLIHCLISSHSPNTIGWKRLNILPLVISIKVVELVLTSHAQFLIKFDTW